MNESTAYQLNHLWSLGNSSCAAAPGASRHYMRQMQAIAHAQGLQIDEKTFCPHCGTIYQFGKSCVAKHLPGVKKRSTCIKRMAIKCSKCQFRQEVRVKIERKKPKAVDVAKSASRASTVVPARKSEQQAKHSPKPPQNSAGMKEKPKQSGLGKFLSNIGIK